MKLIYLFNGRLPTEKAYGIQVAKMCEAFAEEGHEVKLLYPYRKNPSISQDIFSYYFVKKNFLTKEVKSGDFYLPGLLDKIAFLIKNYFSAKALAGEALKENANIYYTRDELVAYLLSKKNKNVIFECHRFSNKRKRFYFCFKKKNLKIIAISNGIREDLVKFGIKDSDILVAHDGVDLADFDIDISKEEARARADLPLDKKIIMYAGHLFEWKGTGTLLEAAKLISSDQFLTAKNFLFVFVGGTEYDIEKFQQKIKDMDLKNVLILGHKPHKEMPVYLKAADLLVLPNSAKEEISKSYTSPLKLFEYMASKRPIVASNLPSIKEVLDQNNSWLAESDNSRQLAETIKKVINDPIKSNQLAQKAFEDVKNYTWAGRVRKILDFI